MINSNWALGPADVSGDLFALARTNPDHMGAPGDPPVADTPRTDFGSMLIDGLNEVSSLERTHEHLSVQAIVDPDSVNPHDVTIAASQASLALNLTRNVVDRVVQAYQEITNLR